MKNKAFALLMLVILIITSIIGCNNNTRSTDIKDYFPFKENAVYLYVDEDTEETQYIIFNDYIKTQENLYQRRNMRFNIITNDILSFSGDQLVAVNTFGSNADYFYDMTSQPPSGEQAIALQQPLVKGQKWIRAKLTDEYNIVSEVTNDNIKVTVPYGTFDAIEITNVYEGTVAYENVNALAETIEYYAPDIGLIKTEEHILTYGRDEYVKNVIVLKDIQENFGYTKKIDFFYPATTATDYELKIEEKTHTFMTNNTNEDLCAMFAEGFKNYTAENSNPVIGSNVKINSIDFDYADASVKVDFSKELVTEMNAGAGYEKALLQSIVNTIALYFRVPDVAITIEGGGYESGHISMGPDEYMRYEYEATLEEESTEAEE